MIIDIHTHVFPDAIASKSVAFLTEKAAGAVHASTDGTLNGLKKSMRKSGVDVSVVQPVVTRPSQFDSINRFAAEINGRDGVYSFGGIHPDDETPQEHIAAIRALGLRGVKLHPDYQGVMIDDPRNIRLIRLAVETGLLVMTHAGFDVGFPELIHCPPPAAKRMLEAVYGADRSRVEPRIILAHLGGYTQLDEVAAYLAGEPVYLDVSFALPRVEPEAVLRLIRAHGADRILFGSDCPWGDQADFVARMRALPLSDAEREAIMGGNAKRILGL
ncbi:MAG: amidohydrolase [Clostridia bacterium]|nr:amidohydrolase [Clostridia bacterium]